MTRSAKQHNRTLDAKAKPFARALEAWLLKVARAQSRREAAKARGVVAKARLSKRERDELLSLILRFGLDRVRSAANDSARETLVTSRMVLAAIAGRVPQLVGLPEIVAGAKKRARQIEVETLDLVRRSVRQIISDAEKEAKAIPQREVARRIARAFHGDGERVYAFSYGRADRIAQTELAIAENSGIVSGYEATGVKEIEWISVTDGRSGDRHHERMNGKRVKLGQTFTLPSGAKARHPGDPALPVGEIVNCRCTTRPVR